MDREMMPLILKTIPRLLAWYDAGHRQLPWRSDPTAYHVWLSEIMLQQTRVETVKGYYTRFLETLPDVQSLANATEEEYLKLWEGLGYYNRVRNLNKAAQVIMEVHDGVFPDDYEQVQRLPGIGSYTAGAICSIAFGQQVPAVDGNVLRVLSRVLNLDWDIAKASVKTQLEQWITQVMKETDLKRPGDYNQALMELGAMVCTPNGIAKCEQCPLADVCGAKGAATVMDLPVKTGKKPRRIEQKTVLMLYRDNEIAIRKRPNKGLLAGLYEFPMLDGVLNGDEVLCYLKEQGLEAIRYKALPKAKHIFTHIEWHMTAFAVRLDETQDGYKNDQLYQKFVCPEALNQTYAVPSAFSAYLEYVDHIAFD